MLLDFNYQNHFYFYYLIFYLREGYYIEKTNEFNYTVKIAITRMTNKSIDKFITVSPKSISVIKYGLKNNDDNTICSIVFHCAKENLNGLFTSGTARIKSKN